MNEATLIGIDCAGAAGTVGLARANFSQNRVIVVEVCSKKYTRIDSTILRWITDHEATGVLLALDSPLGWPVAMGPFLSDHAAGEPADSATGGELESASEVGAAANKLFRRTTDHRIETILQKAANPTTRPPLEIGANTIARVAHASLRLLDRLRNSSSGRRIPLGWNPGPKRFGGIEAIEVYPAATLRVHGLMKEGYKKDKGQREEVRNLMMSEGYVEFADEAEKAKAVRNDHMLDAVVCCLAAADYLRGPVVEPSKAEERFARKEGWIWVADKTGNGNRESH